MLLPPLSLYVHIPWCVRKCPYCDFNSHSGDPKHLPENEYLASVLKDLQADARLAQGRKLQSIFFGGGTPSLMSERFYEVFLSEAEKQIGFAPDIEITLEANPGTAEAGRFKGYRSAGIDRLSMGVQSFSDHKLKALGRIHDGGEAEHAYQLARQAGFSNINLDLMHGLPDQSEADALEDLNRAIQLGPEHLSWYQLTIEPNTEFFRRPPTLPEDETLWQIQDAGMARLAEAGYGQYEISAFAQPDKRACHNLNYWLFGDYLGIGAGAHGKVTCIEGETQKIWRYRKSRMPADYMKPRIHYRIGEEEVSPEELPLEYLLNVLRLNEGVSEEEFVAATQQALATLEPTLSQLRKDELLEPNRLQPTERGRLFLNEVLGRFSR
jgi:oxygen-independent coproporphyrinogen-3 oxidase